MISRNVTKENVMQAIRGAGSRLRALGVESIGLFGSFVRAQGREDSDVDLLVEFRPESKTFDNFMDTCFLLEELLGRRVELVTRESLSPYIGPYVLKEVEYVPLSN